MQEEVDFVEKLLFLDGIEGRNLFQLDIEGAGEEGFGVILDQGSRFGIGRRGDVDGLFELVDSVRYQQSWSDDIGSLRLTAS